MLELETKKWSEFSNNGELVLSLLLKAQQGDESVYGELYNQICHQNSVHKLAYATIPYLVKIAEKNKPENKIWPLSIVGSIVASRQVYCKEAQKIPTDMLNDYNLSLKTAFLITVETLKEPLNQRDVMSLLATLAALKGEGNLAILLYDYEINQKLSCPKCGEFIEYA